jgi:peptidyl-tRNA hydrolase
MDIVCYVLVRSDLPSLNPGKAMSQTHHAGVQMMAQRESHKIVDQYVQSGCYQGADHFNTTIVLAATKNQISAKHVEAVQAGIKAKGMVTDPSYPFTVENCEIANLVENGHDIKIVNDLRDGRVLMVRPELTCAWFVIDRDNHDHKMIFEDLKLYP